jgi:hypothetical protein
MEVGNQVHAPVHLLQCVRTCSAHWMVTGWVGPRTDTDVITNVAGIIIIIVIGALL